MTTFNGFWHGPPLGAIRTACLKSFIEQGHEFKLYTYRFQEEIPAGIDVEDANTIIPESEISWFGSDIGPFSDLFRYTLLKEKGGWWCDVDTVCLSRSIPELDEAWSLEWPEIDPNQVGNGQICLRKDSLFAKLLHEKCLDKSKYQLENRSSLGPHLFSDTIKALDLCKNQNGNPEQFYPINWLSSFKLWLPEYCEEIEKKTINAYFLPIYQSFPSWCGIDLLRLPPEGSYLHRFLEKHGCLDKSLSIHSASSIRNAVRDFLVQQGDSTLGYLGKTCGQKVFRELEIKPPRKSLKRKIKMGLRQGLQMVTRKLTSPCS